jgi:hypothetical protein
MLVYTKKENTRDRMIECLTQKEEEKNKNKCKIYHIEIIFFYQICLLKGKYTETIITGLIKYTDLTNTHIKREREIYEIPRFIKKKYCINLN